MFDLKRPCKTCPFRRENGANFALTEGRLEEVFRSVAFQCHDTVEYFDEGNRQGDNPQQCAGLIILQYKEKDANAITQVATRTIGYDPSNLREQDQVYDNYQECVEGHNGTPARRRQNRGRTD